MRLVGRMCTRHGRVESNSLGQLWGKQRLNLLVRALRLAVVFSKWAKGMAQPFQSHGEEMGLEAFQRQGERTMENRDSKLPWLLKWILRL